MRRIYFKNYEQKKTDQILLLLKEDKKLFLSICFGVFLFILFFQPFQLERFDFNNRLLIVAGMGLLIGLKAYLVIQLPVLVISHVAGLWLFYIQHQFEDVSWNRNINWDYKTAAIEGSSFLKLPAVLQWFTGNIGFHHLHHLSPRIPNYKVHFST